MQKFFSESNQLSLTLILGNVARDQFVIQLLLLFPVNNTMFENKCSKPLSYIVASNLLSVYADYFLLQKF